MADRRTQRFHDVVTANPDAARHQIAELEPASPATDGPCALDRACMSAASDESPPAPVVLGMVASDVPIACSLGPTALSQRIDDWQAILTTATGRSATPDGGLRVELGGGVDVGRLGQLVADEQSCCAFLAFAITVDGRGVALEVRAPDDATDVVGALFGRPPPTLSS